LLRQIVQKARDGDLEAFGRLVERFQGAVFGTAYALVGDFHDAQDLAQESFVRAWRRLGDLRDPDRFAGWLYRITRNRCLDFLRRRGAASVPLSRAAALASGTPAAPERLEKAEMREAVLAAVRALSEPNRLATALFYIDGYTVREVAEFLEVPPGTVKRRLHESRKQLRERMTTMVEDELKGARPGPEFRESVMSGIAKVEVRPEKSPGDSGRVILVDEQERCLTIIIGKPEERAIQRGVEGSEPLRPMTHELLLRVLEAFNIRIHEARVTDLREGTFYGELVLERDGQMQALDCRPSDALALAMMVGAKVSVAEKIMAENCVQNPDGSPTEPEDSRNTRLADLVADSNRRAVEIAERISTLPQGAFDRLVEEVGEMEILSVTAPSVRGTPEEHSSVPDEVIGAVRALRDRFDPARLEEAEARLRDLKPSRPARVNAERQMNVLEALDRIEREGDPA